MPTRAFTALLLLLGCAPAAYAEQSPCHIADAPPAFRFESARIDTIEARQLQAELEIREFDGSRIVVHLVAVEETNFPQISKAANRLLLEGGPRPASGITVYSDHSDANISVTVNGNPAAVPLKPPPRIIICLPRGKAVELKIEHVRLLSSSVPVSGAEITLSGAGQARIMNFREGTLKASLSSAARLTVEGEFDKVAAETENASQMETHGPVRAAYAARSAGASTIRHSGTVKGSIDKNESQAGRVHINGSS